MKLGGNKNVKSLAESVYSLQLCLGRPALNNIFLSSLLAIAWNSSSRLTLKPCLLCHGVNQCRFTGRISEDY